MGNHQHGFTGGKSCLKSVTALKITEFVNKGREVGIIYLNLSKLLITVSHNTLASMEGQ